MKSAIYMGLESGHLLCGLRQGERICTQILIDIECFFKGVCVIWGSKDV